MGLFSYLLAFVVLKPVPVEPQAYPRLVQQFPPTPDTVRVFQPDPRHYWLEAEYPDRRVVLQLGSRAYRRLLLGLPLTPTRTLDRLAYVGGQALVALSVYPWALPLTFTPEDQEPSREALALGLVSPLLWTVGSAVYAWQAPVTFSQAYAGFWGGILGFVHGGNLATSLRGCFLGSVTGNLLGQVLARRYRIPEAAIQRWVNGQVYGYFHYGMLHTLLKPRFPEDSPTPYRLALALSLAEGYADLFFSRNDTTLTLGDALFEFRVAIIGSELLPALVLSYDLARISHQSLDEPTSSRVYAGLSLAGNLAGLALGRYLSRRFDLSVPGALITFLAPVLAHTFTGGLMVLLRPNPAVYPLLFMATEVGITTLTYRMVRHTPLPRSSSLQRVVPFARRSTLPGQGTVWGLAVQF